VRSDKLAHNWAGWPPADDDDQILLVLPPSHAVNTYREDLDVRITDQDRELLAIEASINDAGAARASLRNELAAGGVQLIRVTAMWLHGCVCLLPAAPRTQPCPRQDWDRPMLESWRPGPGGSRGSLCLGPLGSCAGLNADHAATDVVIANAAHAELAQLRVAMAQKEQEAARHAMLLVRCCVMGRAWVRAAWSLTFQVMPLV
jgi:hypothetical protein